MRELKERACKECGQTFMPTAKRGPVPKFCSRICYMQDWSHKKAMGSR
jgi:hypothetical protein